MKQVLWGVVVLAALFMMTPATHAAEYYESNAWRFDDNRGAGNREVLLLRDDRTGRYLYLRGTSRHCIFDGASYSTMRAVMRRNAHSPVPLQWSIVNRCADGIIRICVENQIGQRACSSYIDAGWIKP